MGGLWSSSRCSDEVPEEVQRWVRSITDVLKDPKGRKEFRSFMEENCTMLKDELKVLDFWEKCEEYLNYNLDENSSPEDKQEARKIAEDILMLADESIDFNSEEMGKLFGVLNTDDGDAVQQVVRRAQTSCADSLDVVYHSFQMHLLGKWKLLKK